MTRTKDQDRAKLLRKYGLTPDDYAAMFKQQHGRCAICGDGPDYPDQWRFAIDHDHDTDEVRGLLCTRCNAGLGLFKDSITNLQMAVRYLREYRDPA